MCMHAPHGVEDEGLIEAHLLGQAPDHLVAQHGLRRVGQHEVAQRLADLQQLRLLQVHRRLFLRGDGDGWVGFSSWLADPPPSKVDDARTYLGGDEGVVQQLLRRPALRRVLLQAPAGLDYELG